MSAARTNGKPRTPPEIRAEGFRALVERLGLADALRFMHQYEPGQGDYTAERGQWLDNLTLDDIKTDVARLRAARQDEERTGKSA